MICNKVDRTSATIPRFIPSFVIMLLFSGGEMEMVGSTIFFLPGMVGEEQLEQAME